jgi:hypothetical protein
VTTYTRVQATRPRALFICGSINQTSQLHKVASALPEVEASFTPYYGDWFAELGRRLHVAEFTIGGNKRRKWCLDYLNSHRLAVDMHGRRGHYDLIVTCTDMLVQPNLGKAKVVLVQEGILDPENWVSRLVERFPRLFPRWFGGTALTGTSNVYDRLCVASEGYRRHFAGKGIADHKIRVTGIPNFDDCVQYLRDNEFPLSNYVLVCTSDGRETFKRDRRAELVRRALTIAGERTLVFKLHPNEPLEKCTHEIHAIAPRARVYQAGSAELMIAKCDVLITEWSSTVFVGMALGKEVYSNHPREHLEAWMPLQNGGRSATNIAAVCRELIGVQPTLRATKRAA